MSKTQKDHLKRMLLDRRASLLSDVKSGMLKSMSREIHRAVEDFMDGGDSHSDHSEKVHSARLRTMRETIRNIEAALERLESGDYGICGECGGEIGLERQRIIPFALYCKDCQEEKEVHEKRKKFRSIFDLRREQIRRL